jgi:hypothetical protein
VHAGRVTLLLAVALALVQPLGAFQQRQVQGTVRDVRDNSRRFMLRANDGRTYEVVYLGPKSGFGVRPPTLRDGNRVEVVGDLVRGVFEAERITLLDGGTSGGDETAALTGRIEAVGTDSRILHVQAAGGQYRVDVRDAEIIGDGRRLALRDLRAGDTVRVSGRQTGNHQVIARRVELMAGGAIAGGGATTGGGTWDAGSIGRIDTVGTSSRVLHVTFGGRRYRVNAQDAEITANGQRVSLSSLRQGDRVRVRGRETAQYEIDARQVDRVDDRPTTAGWRSTDVGRIDAVGTSSGILHVTFGGRQYRVDARNATIRLDDRPGSINDLRKGDRVQIQGDYRGGDTIQARRVVAVR